MDPTTLTRPTGVSLNGRRTNTTVEPVLAPWAKARPVTTTPQLHGLEDDPQLYEVVLQRVRTSGETVRIEDVIGQLDERGAGQQEL